MAVLLKCLEYDPNAGLENNPYWILFDITNWMVGLAFCQYVVEPIDYWVDACAVIDLRSFFGVLLPRSFKKESRIRKFN